MGRPKGSTEINLVLDGMQTAKVLQEGDPPSHVTLYILGFGPLTYRLDREKYDRRKLRKSEAKALTESVAKQLRKGGRPVAQGNALESGSAESSGPEAVRLPPNETPLSEQ